MTEISARFTFYTIDACGYYEYGEDTPLFGSSLSMLHNLQTWIESSNLNVGDTCTYEPEEDSSLLPTYCFDISHNTEDEFLLITWNEIPTIDGKTPTVNSQDRVGGAHIDLTDLPEGGIPGYPTYFWFLPNRELFATVTIGDTRNGHPNLKTYLAGFLENFSNYVCRGDEEGEVIGYRNGANDTSQHVYPRFQSSRMHKASAITYIQNNRASITKCIRKMEVEPQVERDVGVFRQMFEHLTGLDSQQDAVEPLRIRYEINTTPTEDELNAMVSEWENQPTTRWDDVGFRIKGDNRNIRWLSHSLARSDFDLSVEGEVDPAVSAESLLDAIEDRRSAVMTVLEGS